MIFAESQRLTSGTATALMTHVLLVSSDNPPTNIADVLVLWDAWCPPNDYTGRWVSLPAEIQHHQVEFRDRYMSWLADVAASSAGGKTLADRLVIRPGLSYWWLTAPSEFTYARTSLANAIVRVMAFVDWAEHEGVTSVTSALTGAEPNGTIAEWCRRSRRAFDLLTTERQPQTTRSSGRPLFAACRRWARSWRDARAAPRAITPASDGSRLLVVDYLAHMRGEADEQRPGYWTVLPELLRGRDVALSWLHVYVPAPSTPTTGDAVQLAQQLEIVDNEPHTVVQASAPLRVRFGAIRDYLRVRRMRRFLCRPERRPLLMGLDVWRLLVDRTTNSFLGSEAMDNCLWLRYFDHHLSRIPRQDVGIYLQENQPWEFALLEAWRSNGHGTIVGVQHTTVRYWDLRYVKQATPGGLGPSAMPRPDVSLLNGPAASRALQKAEPLGGRVTEVEALRFLAPGDPHEVTPIAREATGSPRLLVVAEYDPDYARDMARLVDEVLEWAGQKGEQIDVVWRPHPAAPDTGVGLPQVVRVDADTPLGTLMSECDIALLGDFSSALVDARILGVSSAVLPPARTLSTAPLGDQERGDVTTDPGALLDRLLEAARRRPTHDTVSASAGALFHRDPRLPRWQRELDALGLVEPG